MSFCMALALPSDMHPLPTITSFIMTSYAPLLPGQRAIDVWNDDTAAHVGFALKARIGHLPRGQQDGRDVDLPVLHVECPAEANELSEASTRHVA